MLRLLRKRPFCDRSPTLSAACLALEPRLARRGYESPQRRTRHMRRHRLADLLHAIDARAVRNASQQLASPYDHAGERRYGGVCRGAW
jgi:hypothetical protein